MSQERPLLRHLRRKQEKCINQICNIMELSDAELMFVDGGRAGGGDGAN